MLRLGYFIVSEWPDHWCTTHTREEWKIMSFKGYAVPKTTQDSISSTTKGWNECKYKPTAFGLNILGCPEMNANPATWLKLLHINCMHQSLIQFSALLEC